jgi:hypothetical protein
MTLSWQLCFLWELWFDARMAVSPKEFRKLALSLPETIEGSHMGHADFRAGGKIFATLGYPDKNYGMVKLAPADQARLIDPEAGTFMPAAGAWGRQGATIVLLKSVDKDVLRGAIEKAWRNVAPKKPSKPR